LDAALTRIAQRCGRGDHGIKMFNDYKFTRSDDIDLANEAFWLNPKNKRRAKTRTRPYKSN
jgi:hypothetical protein